MTNLEKLLEGVEVEWKTLGEICKVLRGKRLTKRDLVQDAQYPIFHGGLEPIGYYSKNNRLANSTMLINVGASAGTVGFCNHDFWSSDGCFCFSHNDIVNQRYLFYALQSIEHTIKSKVRKAGIPTLDNKYIERLLIPIPCPKNQNKSLEIQRKIVDILDKFTTLETELEAELDCRKRQYEYYRNKLLSFDKLNNIIWMSINDVCENICSGGTPLTSKQEYYQGNIPWLRTQDVNWKEVYDTDVKISEEAIESSSAKIIPRNCVIVAMYGATAAKACINKIPLTTNQACCNLQINGQIANYKYVYYWLCHEYNNLKALGEGSQSNINGRKIKAYKIPIPSLSEQQRIVSILDKFEILTTSISEGLPKEIELRRKQYEYYRNKLLSFPNAKIKL